MSKVAKVARKKKVVEPAKPSIVFNTFAASPEVVTEESIIMKLNVPAQTDNEGHEPTPFNAGVFDDNMDVIDYVLPNEGDLAALKVVNLLKDFQPRNNNGWPQSTNIHCYWCCHPFQTVPYGLPVKYLNAKFFVTGCYCSLECCLAYNNDSKSSLDEILERKNMINMLSYTLGCKTAVKAAPNRLALKCFGGHMTIDDFRTFGHTNKLININMPPMVTLTQQIEEVNENDINRDFRYVPIDTDRINKYKEKIMIKRSKPVYEVKNTLDHVMKLTFA